MINMVVKWKEFKRTLDSELVWRNVKGSDYWIQGRIVSFVSRYSGLISAVILVERVSEQDLSIEKKYLTSKDLDDDIVFVSVDNIQDVYVVPA